MMETNNGGKTSYYDIPHPTRKELFDLLEDKEKSNVAKVEIILSMFPDTLNDLIVYKRMCPRLHEVFKAAYAMTERSERGIQGGTIREWNKIIYYATLGRDIALGKKKQIEVKNGELS